MVDISKDQCTFAGRTCNHEPNRSSLRLPPWQSLQRRLRPAHPQSLLATRTDKRWEFTPHRGV